MPYNGKLVLTLGLFAILLGCGGDTTVNVTPPAAASPLKATLDEIASSGEMGSGADELPDLLATLKTSDPAKGDALMAEYEQLKSLKDPAAIKAKAKKMADQL